MPPGGAVQPTDLQGAAGDCIDGNEQPGAKGYDFDQHTSGIASAVTVPVSSAVTAVAVHQDTDEIIAGTENGALLLLSA